MPSKYQWLKEQVAVKPYFWGLKPYVSQNVPPGQSTHEWSQLQQFIPVVGKKCHPANIKHHQETMT